MSETDPVMYNNLRAMPEATSVDQGIIPKGHKYYDAENAENNQVPNPTNVNRAAWTLNALDVFAHETFGQLEHEDAETVLSDFLCDFMHLCRVNGLDFDELVDRGRGHFDREKHDGGW